MNLANAQHHRLAVAPMMDWTDRHCRVFHRMLAPSAMLYTEMVTADAILHGDRDRLLCGHHQEAGDAVVLQLGGADPEALAAAIRLARPYGYMEYNLNVGCPSDRVKSGRFGACLMAEPALVAALTAAMIDAAEGRPVSVKCRIGIDDMDPEEGLDRFIETVASSGVRHFIIHARKAWLNGLSPKENRTIPPLDYDRVARLAKSFPELSFSLNGGITRADAARDLGEGFAGVMIGRAAYQTPHELALMAAAIQGDGRADRFAIARAMADYAEMEQEKGTRLIAISRHMLGLMSGLPGARAWRRTLSEDAREETADAGVIREATDRLEARIHAQQDAA
ncbi:tRNA dihydrouridine(20/20a) synthase DusA [Alphaproteobacteria bacterium LSUCC0684]